MIELLVILAVAIVVIIIVVLVLVVISEVFKRSFASTPNSSYQ